MRFIANTNVDSKQKCWHIGGRRKEMHMPDSPVMTVEEAAKVLRISRNSAYEAVKCGEIPSMRFGRLIRISRVVISKMVGEAA